MPVAETVAFELSEPGTGAPEPIPNYQNPGADKAIAGNWRRDSPPQAFPEYADPFLSPIFITMADLPFESS